MFNSQPNHSTSGSSPSTPNNRRRTSSFNFFSNLTNTIRNSSSSPNLLINNDNTYHQSNTGIISPNRSRTTSSSSSSRQNNSNQPINNPSRINIIPNNNLNPNLNEDFYYSSTPTEELHPSSIPRSKPDSNGLYSIRLTPFIDHSINTPSLYFQPILRKIEPNSKLSIGRYTEKIKEAAFASSLSLLPIVFKSKVVSRIHAEFYCDFNGNWFIKDCKSSSGTFLNHIRLSSAGVESLNTQLSNGDVLQLGMDFRGGIEDIFRCVKIKIELNKSWQRKPKKFNREIHEKFLNLTTNDDDSTSSECAICLSQLKPCQSIFVSSCSHCWHYKCIRPILVKNYPQFLCPNCRESCDLEADLEEDEDDDQLSSDDELIEDDDRIINNDMNELTDEDIEK
ncbi:hypothetical protein WICMUC_005546 [Wickerhamomyces mucosus]|uniref:RING-type E3 ubiquitin transferase n=1 Tax=Wickerhamomyces mucosus TaxID=1378264 RepID=A0A9P8P860_9ASCO|nr:hypothetical protein WICMUC_005546 [Wickerhamomyces mucosus]